MLYMLGNGRLYISMLTHATIEVAFSGFYFGMNDRAPHLPIVGRLLRYRDLFCSIVWPWDDS